MAGVILKEDLAAYQRWHASSFDQKPPPSPPSEPSTSPTPDSSEPEIITTLGLPTADDIERINEAARSEGYQAGFDEGREAAEASRASAIAEEISRFSALVGNLQVALAHMDQSIAEQVLDLALEVASQVIRATVSARPEALLPVIREAIAALPLHHAHVLLHLNPADASVVREHIGEQLTLTGTQIIDDAAISQGGCLLKAGTSEIDATVETRWKRVLEAIGSELREWQNSPP
ncbi:MAG: flagellar assembly protein FliH [Rhodocyclaceae bacterium]|nr:flagellar assembly protein FliH [Rhodocyclaceae bacterium]